jgi:glycosyltransferase involved in cell wall biosynthesis
LLHRYLDLRSRRQDVHLVVVGDGPYREEMESALGREVTFTAFLQGEALARLFAYCDIFVFPSATDTLGRAVVEAQASGLPAVVYDIGGPRECIRPGETGFGDEKEFFEKLELLVDNAALRRRMGRATTLSWRAVLQGVLDIHLGLAEGSAPPRVPAES